jgi:hypothetical protein
MPFPKSSGEIEIEQIMDDPKQGDRFHEFYAFWGYVLGRNGDNVTFLTASAPCELPKDGKVSTLPLDGFRKKFAYSNGQGYYVTGAGRGHNVSGWLDEINTKEWMPVI